MPYQVNLDRCILASSEDYPHILGNLMLNDYLRGLRDGRLDERSFLEKFNDGEQNHVRLNGLRNRFISCQSANVKGFMEDPRGAGLAYSQWLNKWYVGFGRLKQIFAALFAHISRVKVLLNEDQFDHKTVFTQKLEEGILRSFARCVLPDNMGLADEAVEWYREALPHNPVHCLEYCMNEFVLEQMEVEALSWKEPGVRKNHAGITVPRILQDTFADNHEALLAACFGRSAQGNNDLESQPIGRLIERVLKEAIKLLLGRAGQENNKFDLQRTYVDDFGEDEMYSAIVCMQPYCDITTQHMKAVQPSLAALEGIAMLHCDKPMDEWFNTEPFKTLLMARQDLLEGGRGPEDVNLYWDDQKRFVTGVRTDLYRVLKTSGVTENHNSFSFVCSYHEGRDHDAVRKLCMYPAENLGTAQIFAFWPHPNPKIDRELVPIECTRTIMDINRRMLEWRDNILGKKKETEGLFRPIAIASAQNVNAPLAVQPTAVRVVNVETAASRVASEIEAVTGGSVRPGSVRASDIFAHVEPELIALEERRVELAGPPHKRRRIAPRRVEFNLEDAHAPSPEPPGVTVTQKAINNQVWIWGLIILLILGYVTLRRR